jgi:hypothetical protein
MELPYIIEQRCFQILEEVRERLANTTTPRCNSLATLSLRRSSAISDENKSKN